VLAEAIGGGAGFYSMAVFASLAPEDHCERETGPFASKGFVHSLVGFYTGYCLGNSWGVYLGGRSKYKGSYLNTFLGMSLGVLGGFAVLHFASRFDNPKVSCAAPYLLIIAPTVGSFAGFYSSKTKDVSRIEHPGVNVLSSSARSDFPFRCDFSINLVGVFFLLLGGDGEWQKSC